MWFAVEYVEFGVKTGEKARFSKNWQSDNTGRAIDYKRILWGVADLFDAPSHSRRIVAENRDCEHGPFQVGPSCSLFQNST